MANGKALGAVALGAAIAALFVWRRRSHRRERVDLYFADGSMVSFEQGSLEAGRLLPLAHDILAAARGGARF